MSDPMTVALDDLNRSVDAACGDMHRLLIQRAELLAALKALRHFSSGLQGHGRDAREVFAAVDAAIAKAEGR